MSHRMNIMPFYEDLRLVTESINTMWKHFTEVINKVRRRVIFSKVDIQPSFFLKPVESPPSGNFSDQKNAGNGQLT